jgi:inhibitor of KinA sporulation pathway (predicted exonuclease)
VARLTDALEQLEFDLDKYRADDASALLNRRLMLRKALEAWGREQYGEGHRDGMRDARDTAQMAREREREAAEAAAKEESPDG